MSAPLVLSLFPGIGLLDMAFEEEGFCVVRGPDLLWGGDIRRFHPPQRAFQGVIGGPPCQEFSRLIHVVRANGYEPRHPDRIPEFRRVVEEAGPDWYLMENVPAAYGPDVRGYWESRRLVCDRSVGGSTSRTRAFWFGSLCSINRIKCELPIEVLALEAFGEPAKAVTGDSRQVPVAIGGSGKPKRPKGGGTMPHVGPSLPLSEMCRLQGLPENFLADAPFTSSAKRQVIGNGVPLPMGRAIARAVKAAVYPELAEVPA